MAVYDINAVPFLIAIEKDVVVLVFGSLYNVRV